MYTHYNTPESILSIFTQYKGPFNLAMLQHYYSPLDDHSLQAILNQLVEAGSIVAIENGYYRLAQ